jgi:hypothetical protein
MSEIRNEKPLSLFLNTRRMGEKRRERERYRERVTGLS